MSNVPPTPLVCSDRIGQGAEESAQELDPERTFKYRQCVGALLHVTQDRGYLSYAVRLLAQDLTKPKESGWKRLKRVVRYAYGTRELET